MNMTYGGTYKINMGRATSISPTWLTLERIPKPILEDSLPTNITGTSPVTSVNKAMLDEVGAEGFSEPVAKTPEDGSEENAREEMMPESG